MAPLVVLILLGIVAFAVFSLFLNTPPARVVSFLRKAGPIATMILGGGLLLLGRAGIGLTLVMLGGSWAYRNRGVSSAPHRSGSQTSTVRSAWVEMELDLDTGDLDGIVLAGTQEGARLSDMDEETLFAFYQSVQEDAESAGLLEAYLDRVSPAWRENTDAGAGRRHGHSASAGPMSKEEAYQVLGLAKGATAAEVKAAHRRLMKAVHPDSGGSTFLAARINEAKQMLLD